MINRKPSNFQKVDSDGVLKRSEDLKRFVSDWNLNYPIDLWWRKRKDTTFNSFQHRSVCLLDVLVEAEEYIEIKMSIKYRYSDLKKEKEKVEEISNKDLENFENLDLSKFK